jgi:hypothetical protein
MAANWKKTLGGVLVIPLLVLGTWLFWLYHRVSTPLAVYQPRPLRMVVADPWCRPSAGAGVVSRVQRDYAPLAGFLETQLQRPVELLYSDELRGTFQTQGAAVDLIIGKVAAVSFEAAQANEPVRPLARLTGKDGTDVFGLSSCARRSGATAGISGPSHSVRTAAMTAARGRLRCPTEGVTPVPPLQTMASRGAYSRRDQR